MVLIERSRARLRALLLTSTVFIACGAPPVSAQVAGQVSPPPVRQPIDDNGVDVLRGTLNVALTDVTIGPNDYHGLAYRRIGDIYSEMAVIEGTPGGGGLTVTIEGVSDGFYQSGNGYVSTEGSGATLAYAGGLYIYTSSDGTVARFAGNSGYQYPFYEGEFARLASITYPDGTVRAYTYRVQTYCYGGYEGTCQSPLTYVARLQSVRSSTGYQLAIRYASDAQRLDDQTYPDWGRPTSVTAINNAVDYCDPSALTCSLANDWPTATYANGTATDAMGRPIVAHVTATYDGGQVATATRDGITYAYAYSDNGSTRTTTVTDPTGARETYVGDLTTGLLSSHADALGHVTAYAHDGSGRVTAITFPEGNAVGYAYDARGNVTQTTVMPKPGSTLPAIVTTAGYDATCANQKTCNKPNWTRDARGSQTDYGYDGTHGGLLSVTAPPGASGVRPQTRYT